MLHFFQLICEFSHKIDLENLETKHNYIPVLTYIGSHSNDVKHLLLRLKKQNKFVLSYYANLSSKGMNRPKHGAKFYTHPGI